DSKDEGTREKVIARLTELGPRARPAASRLVRLLLEEEEQIALQAGEALSAIGPEVLPLLLKAMRAGTAESRRRIATVLVESRWDNKLIRPALLTALKDTDSRVRQVAAHGLGMREDRDAIPALIRVVQTDGDRSVRAEAIGSLAFFTSEAR